MLEGCAVSGEVNIEKALNFIRDNAGKFAEAKAQRIYLEQFRKSKKALLFAACPTPPGEKVTVADREAYAYSHPEYLELLTGLQVAIEAEETLKWQMTAAQLKTEVWRTQQANNRRTDSAHT
jgi:hypothetical protein